MKQLYPVKPGEPDEAEQPKKSVESDQAGQLDVSDEADQPGKPAESDKAGQLDILDQQEQNTVNERIAIPRVRIIMGLILFLVYVVLIRDSFVQDIYLGIVTIVGMGSLFDPIISYLDKFEPALTKVERIFVSYIRAPDSVFKRWVTRHILTPAPFLGTVGTFVLAPIYGITRFIQATMHLSLRHPNISVIVILLFTLIYQSSAGAINTITDVVVNDDVCSQVNLVVCSSGVGMTTLSDGVHVGLITYDSGQGPFDTSTYDNQEKQVEADIFRLDKTACVGQHATFAIVTMLSRTVEDPADSATAGLNNLRGAFLAQNAYEATHPSVKACLVVANLGTDATTSQSCSGCYSLPLIIRRLTEFARHDTSFHGIIGFPYSQQAYDALQIIRSSGLTSIPIVSPSASSDYLSNIPDFFRVVSSDERQSEAMMRYFCNALHNGSAPGMIDIFDDDQNAYIHSLSSDFTKNLNCTNSVTHDSYVVGDESSIQTATDNAVKKNAAFIVFPGYSSDLVMLEEELEMDLQSNAAHVTILGGDGLYDTAGVDYNTFAPVYFTTYGPPIPNSSSFVQEYRARQFPLPFLTPYQTAYTFLTEDAVLSYDALSVFTHALAGVSATDFSQQEFNNAVATVSFQDGLSGYISLNGLVTTSRTISDPLNKTVYIMCTDRQHILHWVGVYGTDNGVQFQSDQKRPC